ncbi:DUF2752 domain-containing protein [Pontibacter ummariensis]|uniref:DUF2752 domain-containing protein n=1 Tax=Pontibacter ummariensis TaxID=1610492 RepID=UPI001FEC0407|nr:DUF2752 domain-containing protein [Pontibacter ummariensis]
MKLLLRHRSRASFLRQTSYLLEVLLWGAGLFTLAFLKPEGEHLFSLCPFSWLLEGGCPGCGLGHGIAYLFRGNLAASWEAHPLAVPAVVLLAVRCGKLLHWQRNHFKKQP